ncbi:MAG: hypothetical protein ACPHXR_04185 [Flavicella sp.]
MSINNISLAFVILLIVLSVHAQVTLTKNHFKVTTGNEFCDNYSGIQHKKGKENLDQKFVGLFYWSWHQKPFINVEPVNITHIISQHPDAINDYNNSVWRRGGRYHWGESIYGYYISTDKWVLRKHAEMLADAQVDVIVFDTTNSPWLWDASVEAIGAVWKEAKRDGIAVPAIAFMMPFTPHDKSKEMIERLYNEVYKKEKYKDFWFYWKGKPLLMGYNDNVSQEVKSFFTFRAPKGSYKKLPEHKIRADHWGWCEVYPQNQFVKSNSSSGFEQVTVSVAQNATKKLMPAAMNDKNQVFGRSYTHKNGMSTTKGAVNKGLNFQEQWDRAMALDPEFIFVTGWNEWTAGRYKTWQGTTNAFPDQFTQEYSRDIEPMKGGHGDNYYVQFVKNIQKFKKQDNLEENYTSSTINLDGNFDDWENVLPIYKDPIDQFPHRNSRGYGSKWYMNNSIVNDIVQTKVSIDEFFVHFFVKTKKQLQIINEQSMILFIDVDRNKDTGWEGYDFRINRDKNNLKNCVLSFHKEGFNWDKQLGIAYETNGNMLELKIPKQLFKSNILNFEFKWWDNSTQKITSAIDFYVNGDCAPSEYFNYTYKPNN